MEVVRCGVVLVCGCFGLCAFGRRRSRPSGAAAADGGLERLGGLWLLRRLQ